MPKGHVTERDCICRACGGTFRSTKVGKASFFCHTDECEAAQQARRDAERTQRQLARKRARESQRRVQADARAREMAERKAHRARGREEARAEAAERRAEEVAARRRQREEEREQRRRDEAASRRMARRRIEMFRPILEDPEQGLLADEFLEVLRIASQERIDLPRQALKGAIVRVAHAEGQKSQHLAYQHLAAVAVRLADMTRPRAIREPSVEQIVEAIAA